MRNFSRLGRDLFALVADYAYVKSWMVDRHVPFVLVRINREWDVLYARLRGLEWTAGKRGLVDEDSGPDDPCSNKKWLLARGCLYVEVGGSLHIIDKSRVREARDIRNSDKGTADETLIAFRCRTWFEASSITEDITGYCNTRLIDTNEVVCRTRRGRHFVYSNYEDEASRRR